jgi:hypothetical protein
LRNVREQAEFGKLLLENFVTNHRNLEVSSPISEHIEVEFREIRGRSRGFSLNNQFLNGVLHTLRMLQQDKYPLLGIRMLGSQYGRLAYPNFILTYGVVYLGQIYGDLNRIDKSLSDYAYIELNTDLRKLASPFNNLITPTKRYVQHRGDGYDQVRGKCSHEDRAVPDPASRTPPARRTGVGWCVSYAVEI